MPGFDRNIFECVNDKLNHANGAFTLLIRSVNWYITHTTCCWRLIIYFNKSRMLWQSKMLCARVSNPSNLLFRALWRHSTEVYLLQGSFDQVHWVGAVGCRVHTFLRDDVADIPERFFVRRLSLLVWHLQLPLVQDYPTYHVNVLGTKTLLQVLGLRLLALWVENKVWWILSYFVLNSTSLEVSAWKLEYESSYVVAGFSCDTGATMYVYWVKER